MPDQNKLLVVDDELERGDPLSQRLAGQGYAVDVAKDSLEVLEKILRAKYDMVVLDHTNPGLTGLDLLRLLRATYSASELPVIVVTAAEGSSREEVLRSGATDYVVHPANLPELAARIDTHVSRAKTAQSLKLVDRLTGLGNRDALVAGLNESISGAASVDRPAALLLLDLDGFQRLNDTLGYEAADELLKEAAARIQQAVGSVSWPCASAVTRIGGDEFAVMGSGEDPELLREVAAAILAEVNRPLVVRELHLSLSASIGIAIQCKETSAEGLLRDAHLAMERARHLGGNRSNFFNAGLRERAQNRMSLALELQDAVDQNRLTVLYQPKIGLQEHRLDGFEALVRWRRANGQSVPPSQFIPIAEETGLILKIGGWVLAQACCQLASWQKRFPSNRPLTMNVNVSVRQLTDLRLVGQVQRILEETGIPPETLKLELTESTLLPEVGSARDVLAHLRSLRVGLKLDDFGTGHCSFSYLRALKFESLKISHDFVSKIGTDPGTRAIVESIINLAHALNMNVVAEGIETEAQLRELTNMGCDLGQGYIFYKPLDGAAVEKLLEQGLGAPLTLNAPMFGIAPLSAATRAQ